MSPVLPAQRRAERFDALVERASAAPGAVARDVAGPGDGARHPEMLELLELVAAVRATPRPEPRAAFAADLRARLMAEAPAVLAAAPARPRVAELSVAERLTVAPRRTPRQRRLAAGVAALVAAGATATVAVASQTSLPGEALYPLKRAIENAHTGVSLGEESKGSVLLANAHGRLQEAGLLSRRTDLDDVGVIEQTLEAFTAQAVEASEVLLDDYRSTGNEASVVALRDFTATSIEELGELGEVVPGAARPALLDAAGTIVGIDRAAQEACPACGGEGITDIPPVLVDTGTTPGPVVPAPGPVDVPGVPLPSETAAPPTEGPVVPGPTGPTGGEQPAPTDATTAPPSPADSAAPTTEATGTPSDPGSLLTDPPSATLSDPPGESPSDPPSDSPSAEPVAVEETAQAVVLDPTGEPSDDPGSPAPSP